MVEFNEKDAIAKATDFIFNYVRYTYNVKKGKRITNKIFYGVLT